MFPVTVVHLSHKSLKSQCTILQHAKPTIRICILCIHTTDATHKPKCLNKNAPYRTWKLQTSSSSSPYFEYFSMHVTTQQWWNMKPSKQSVILWQFRFLILSLTYTENYSVSTHEVDRSDTTYINFLPYGQYEQAAEEFSTDTVTSQSITNSTEQSPSWEADGGSASQEIHLGRNPKVRDHIHKADHWTQSWTRGVQSTLPHPTPYDSRQYHPPSNGHFATCPFIASFYCHNFYA